MNVIVPSPLSVAVPLATAMGTPTVAAWPSICVTLSVSPSASVSLPSTAITTGVSSAVVRLSSTATGASFAPLTVMVSVLVAVRPPGSLTV